MLDSESDGFLLVTLPMQPPYSGTLMPLYPNRLLRSTGPGSMSGVTFSPAGHRQNQIGLQMFLPWIGNSS